MKLTIFGMLLFCFLLGTVESYVHQFSYTDRRFYKVAGILYQSPYSGPPVTCSGRPCSVLSCASACERQPECVIFSHNPQQSTCVLSTRPDDDSADYETPDPAWDTYYTRCPVQAGYKFYTNHHPPLCLRFDPQQLQQAGAKQVCWQENANLVRVKSLAVLSIVQSLLTEVGYDDWVWIGAEDKTQEGLFVWSDGTILPLGTSLWNGYGEGYRHDEDCTALSYSEKIIDDGCFYITPFICQYDV